MPDLNQIPPDQRDQGWALRLLRGMVIQAAVIDEVKNSGASTDIKNSIKNVNDFLVTAWRRWCEFSRPFQAQRSLTGRSRYGRLAPFPFTRTRILSTSGVAVLCIFSLGWVIWRGVYLLFLQLQQLPSACFPLRIS